MPDRARRGRLLRGVQGVEGAAKPREAATAASLTHDLLLGTIGVLAGLAAWQMLTIASEASVGIASKGFYSKVREERDGLMRE